MESNRLHAVSPIDGRYALQTQPLQQYFSEAALIKYRIQVEVAYLIALHQVGLNSLKPLSKRDTSLLNGIYLHFSMADAAAVKKIESITNHDVKAVEYFLKKKIAEAKIKTNIEFIHFGLTSQDINNTAFPLAIKDATTQVIIPAWETIMNKIDSLAKAWMKVPMLSRTHGQPASPTKLGKEMLVFVERLNRQLAELRKTVYYAKFGGATGNFNAHHVAFPKVKWNKFADTFVGHLGLKRLQYTTQIEHYDNLCALFDNIKRLNNILIDFNRDVWTYISLDYFKQQINEHEVGSSAMPHKVNPIDFENSEGNLGIANALFEHLSAKLPISRLQRDLTDSTVLRNVGVPFGHTLIATNAVMKGLGKIIVNHDSLANDLEQNWAVVAEGIQTILRREGIANPYEQLKKLTRTNSKIDQQSLHKFVDELNISPKLKAELKKLTPHNYTGIF